MQNIESGEYKYEKTNRVVLKDIPYFDQVCLKFFFKN
jgi:hypothetical protein